MKNISQQDRVLITQAVIKILDGWGLSSQQQIDILSLPEKTSLRTIRQYRESKPLPEDEGVMERVEHIAGISDALATTFPRNAHMAPHWMNKPHKQLFNKSPIRVLVEDGLSGLIQVRMLLDCAYAWSKSC